MRIIRSHSGSGQTQAIFFRSTNEIYERFMDTYTSVWLEWGMDEYFINGAIIVRVQRRFIFGRLPYDNRTAP